MSDDKYPTPVPLPKYRNHETRISELEKNKGAIAAEFSEIQRKIRRLFSKVEMLELGQKKPRDPEDSEASISVHPTRAHFSFKNLDFKVVIVVAIMIIAIVWLLTK